MSEFPYFLPLLISSFLWRWLERVLHGNTQHGEVWAWRETKTREGVMGNVIWEMRMFWARTKFWSLPTLLRWWLRQGREEELCYGNLEVICDDNRSLGILVGTEVSFDWLEELMRGKKVEKACCVISRRRLSLKDSEESWIWVAEIVGARENICKTGKNES